MNKGRDKLFSILLLCIFLIACQNTNQMDRNSLPPSSEQIKNKQEDDNGHLDDQPQLEGGSERDVREPHPVSNDILQKKYPNIVFLHGDPSKNQVALTFDDGPDIRFTPQVLDVLAKHDVKATFFLIGRESRST